MQKMSVRKQRIAKRLEVLGLAFDGQKTNGVYRVGIVTCRTLDEIEEYIKELEIAKEQQSAAEVVVVESVVAKGKKKLSERYEALKQKERTMQMFDIRDVKRIFQSSVVYPNILDNGCPRIHPRKDIYVMDDGFYADTGYKFVKVRKDPISGYFKSHAREASL